jgi:hypothetical protein
MKKDIIKDVKEEIKAFQCYYLKQMNKSLFLQT